MANKEDGFIEVISAPVTMGFLFEDILTSNIFAKNGKENLLQARNPCSLTFDMKASVSIFHNYTLFFQIEENEKIQIT